MINNQLLYQPKVYSDSESESETESGEKSGSDGESFLVNKQIRYVIRKLNIIVDTTDRDWTNSYKSAFDFKVRFNPSENSLVGNVNQFYGSSALSIPINIKNVKSIHLSKIILPNRKYFLDEGSYLSYLDLKSLCIKIDEFSNVVYGTNNTITNSFATLIPLYNGNDNYKFLEFNNISSKGKVFNPAPLNSLNTLSIKITDNFGKILKFRNETLELKTIGTTTSTGNNDNGYLKIVTENYFSKTEHREGDIVIFKNVNLGTLDATKTALKMYLEREEGHKIWFNPDTNYFVEKIKLQVIDNLTNEFFISNKYNFSNGAYAVDSTLDSVPDITSAYTLSGDILNRNLQVLLYFEVESVEKSFDQLKTEII